MRFSYRAFEVWPTPARPHVSVIYRPMVPVHVIGPKGESAVLGLVDTGADETLLPAFLIDPLGLDIDRTAKARF